MLCCAEAGESPSAIPRIVECAKAVDGEMAVLLSRRASSGEGRRPHEERLTGTRVHDFCEPIWFWVKLGSRQ